MTQSPTLIVMAAGIGSRYGGLKQVDPIGPNGEIVIDYAVFDALRAGFGKIVFLIRRDIEEVFREKVGSTIEKHAETIYVFQELNNLPPGFYAPPDRKKPWGTGHAVLSCKEAVQEPFAVINADDFYGPGAFRALADYLRQARDPENGPYDYSMAGYVLENTLSEHGTVSRGVCEVTSDGYLTQVRERTKIKRFADGVKYTENGEDWVNLPANSTVSMNMWGFTPSFFEALEYRFPRFLTENAANLSKAELYLPEVVNQLLREGKATVKVLPVREKWFGVTYPEDREAVQEAIRGLVRQGVYPENLWA